LIVQGPAVIKWVTEHNQADFGSKAVGIGQYVGGRLIAGVVYDNYNGRNIVGAVAIDGVTTRKFWWAIFSYALETLGCTRMTVYVESTNHKSMHLMERLGFEIEGKLAEAGEDGCDIVVQVMWKKNCRMLNWRRNVQENQDPAST
jgi:RimJ/RimL family protein N-acetyltransferase